MSTVINEKYCPYTSSSILRHTHTVEHCAVHHAVLCRAVPFNLIKTKYVVLNVRAVCIVHARARRICQREKRFIQNRIRHINANKTSYQQRFIWCFFRYSPLVVFFFDWNVGSNIRACLCTDMPCNSLLYELIYACANISSIRSNVCEMESGERKLMLAVFVKQFQRKCCSTHTQYYNMLDWSFGVVATQLAVKSNRPVNWYSLSIYWPKK